MNEFEDELHDRLAAQASEVPVAEDWDDLVDRMARRGRRTTRALALALVLTLCVSAVAVVSSIRRDTHSPVVRTASEKPNTVATDRVVATHEAVPRISLSSGASFGAPDVVGAPGGTKPALQVGLVPAFNNDVRLLPGRGGVNVEPYTSMPMARVFTRTTPGGVTIRAYRADVTPESSAQGPPWWTPPGWCFPNGYVQADVSDDAVAGAGYAPLFAAQRDGSKVGGTLSVIGQNEQAVRWIVVAQGPPGAAKLRASFPDGSVDEMAPVGGVAVLVGHGGADLQKAKVTLTAVDASGGTIATTTISAHPPGSHVRRRLHGASDAARARCPPACRRRGRAPGSHRHVQRRLREGWERRRSVRPLRRLTRLRRDHGDPPRRSILKEQVRTAVMKFNDLVFLSPTVAAIQYEIDIPNSSTPSFAPRFNEAHLVAGQWKLARQGWCNDISLAGIQCPA